MCNDSEEYSLEYHFVPSAEAEEQLALAWDIIIALILEDIKVESTCPEREPC